MRIIAGIYKGRVLSAPPGIRPTQDKVRKALFDILGDLDGLSFLELFAGSGAVGFEAASRGATQVALVERNRECVGVLARNVSLLKAPGCTVYPHEADAAVKEFHKRRHVFDIVFMDPPYYKGLAKKALQTLGAYDIVARNGFLIVQHFKKDSLPEVEGDFILFKRSHYGDTLLSFYKHDVSARALSGHL